MIQRWQVAGWLCVGLSVVFAVVSLVLAFQGGPQIVPFGSPRIELLPAVSAELQGAGLLRAVVFGVLAGVAFFTGLACFFWSAVVQAREQRAEIVRLLEDQAARGQSAPPPAPEAS